MLKALKVTAAAIAAQVEVRDVVLGIGLVLVASGLWMVWAPAALIVPGAVLTFVAVRGPAAPSGD